MHDYDREVMNQFVRTQDEDLVGHLPLDHPLRLVPYAAAEALRHGPGGDDLHSWAFEREGATVMGAEVIGATVKPIARFEMDAARIESYGTITTFGGAEVLGQSLDPDTIVYRMKTGGVVALMMQPYRLCSPDNPWCEYSDELKTADPWGPTEYICLAHHGKALPERED